jgi:tetratricopeptide (TPR) repeat protein
LEKAVELDPKDAWAWIFLGGARGNQKNNAGAETAFHKHIIINPFEKEVYGDLLEVLVNDDRVPDILPILDNALSLKDAEIDFKTVIHFIRAFAFLYQQDRTPFIKDLNDATEYLEELVEEKKHEVLGMVIFRKKTSVSTEPMSPNSETSPQSCPAYSGPWIMCWTILKSSFQQKKTKRQKPIRPGGLSIVSPTKSGGLWKK